MTEPEAPPPEPPPAPEPEKPTQTPPEPDAFDLASVWIGKYGALPALAIITIAVLIIHIGVFRGESAGDDLTFHFAESARLADCLRAGDFDFWNPSANAGYASAYYYQVVPQMASALPAAIFGHHLFWFQLSIVLPLVLAPAAAYRGMRLMGASQWQAVGGAFAVAFMNGASRWGSGNAGTFQVGLYTQTWALAAFPLALGHAVRWMTQEKSLAPAIGWGAFVFLCHPFAGVCLGLGILLGWLANAVMYGIDQMLAGIAAGWTPPPALAPIIDRWRQPPQRALAPELARGAILAVALVLTWLPCLLPIFALDKEGFGGFPHRVGDEVGPGFTMLFHWYANGEILDWSGTGRIAFLTWSLPVVAVFARGSFYRWLWAPALVFALLLGLGPHLGKLGDDIFPPVRALGAMQIVLALGIGAGAVSIARWLWQLRTDATSALLARFAVVAAWIGIAVGFGLELWLADGIGLRVMRVVTRDALTPIALRLIGTAPLVGMLLAVPSLWRTLDSVAYTVRIVLSVSLELAAIGFAIVLWTYNDSFALRAMHRLTFGAIDAPITLRLLGTLPVAAAFACLPIVWRALASEYGARTGLAAAGAAIVMFVAVPGGQALESRVRVLEDLPSNNRGEMMQLADFMSKQPQGRKQAGPGCENHWWNLLSYAYYRVPSLLQMGGGGLQASPNYDFLWSQRDLVKNAWVFDAPYLEFSIAQGEKLPEGDSLLKTEHYEIRKLPTAGLVSPVHITGTLPPGYHAGEPGRKAALDWIKSDAPMRDEVLAYAGYGGAGPQPDGKTVRSWRQDSPGDAADIVAEVEVTKPTTYVVRESWHPRWRAYLDGNPIDIKRVTPDFPAVEIPPGKHTLEMRFERPWWAQAAWLLWPGLTIAAWLVMRMRGKRKKPVLPEARVVETTAP